MDELEISGKRYISTRRAAKEYKYHSDYIGQLIRGKKLIGKKVGRSWYVDLDSVSTYFGSDPLRDSEARGTKNIPKAELVAKAVPTPAKEVELPKQKEAEPSQHIAADTIKEKMREVLMKSRLKVVDQLEEKITASIEAGIEEKKDTDNVEENIIQIHTEPSNSIHIPIRRPSYTKPAAKKQNTLRYLNDDTPSIPKIKTVSTDDYALAQVMPQSEREIENDQEEIEIKVNESSNIKLIPVFSVAVLGVVALVVVMFASIMVNSNTVIEAGKSASVGFTLQ